VTELLHRSAAFQPQSFNPETRTVSVIFSSGAPVRRLDFDGPYEERLDLAPEAVDLSELIGGPVLNSHDRFDVNSILGVVETAQVDGQRGTATIRFSERAASIMADVRDGIIKSVSVGYVINQKRVEKDPANGARIITATRWTPKEISFVAIPADPAAKVRGGKSTGRDPAEGTRRKLGGGAKPVGRDHRAARLYEVSVQRASGGRPGHAWRPGAAEGYLVGTANDAGKQRPDEHPDRGPALGRGRGGTETQQDQGLPLPAR